MQRNGTAGLLDIRFLEMNVLPMRTASATHNCESIQMNTLRDVLARVKRIREALSSWDMDFVEAALGGLRDDLWATIEAEGEGG